MDVLGSLMLLLYSLIGQGFFAYCALFFLSLFHVRAFHVKSIAIHIEHFNVVKTSLEILYQYAGIAIALLEEKV